MTFYGVVQAQNNVTVPAEAVQFVPPSLLGDFNSDGVVDVTDVDFYSGSIGLTSADAGFNASLDFNGNGTIELEDHNFHINTYVQTSNGVTGAILGDSNLDGTVDVLSDALTLVANLNRAEPYSYATGDFNADQYVNVLGDGFILVANLGMSTDDSGN